MDANDDPFVQDTRERLSALDRSIFDAVNRRLELVARLRQHKAERGYSFLDPRREQQMVDDAVAANRGPLSADGLRRLYAELLELTKRELP
ncbi:MAG TPA: chorismate mutase [Gaiellaceae bacterium]|nr:chorismate mutase [Gaiellaceae bacterium]